MAQTVQQRFGFEDKGMKTPKHDEIMLWVDQNIQQVLNPFMEKKKRVPEKEANECFKYYMEDNLGSYGDEYRTRAIDEIKAAYTPVDPAQFRNDIEYKVTWEVPIKNGNFIVGFVDMVALAKSFYPSPSIDQQKGCFTWRWRQGNFVLRYFLEVKSTIPSLGELIRQVRMYQAYDDPEDRPTYIVVSPDTRFADAIRSQRIEFIEYIPQGRLL